MVLFLHAALPAVIYHPACGSTALLTLETGFDNNGEVIFLLLLLSQTAKVVGQKSIFEIDTVRFDVSITDSGQAKGCRVFEGKVTCDPIKNWIKVFIVRGRVYYHYNTGKKYPFFRAFKHNEQIVYAYSNQKDSIIQFSLKRGNSLTQDDIHYHTTLYPYKSFKPRKNLKYNLGEYKVEYINDTILHYGKQEIECYLFNRLKWDHPDSGNDRKIEGIICVEKKSLVPILIFQQYYFTKMNVETDSTGKFKLSSYTSPIPKKIEVIKPANLW